MRNSGRVRNVGILFQGPATIIQSHGLATRVVGLQFRCGVGDGQFWRQGEVGPPGHVGVGCEAAGNYRSCLHNAAGTIQRTQARIQR